MVCIIVIIVNQALPCDTEPQDLDVRRQSILTKPPMIEGHQTRSMGASTFPQRCYKKIPIKATLLYHEMVGEMLWPQRVLEHARVSRTAGS